MIDREQVGARIVALRKGEAAGLSRPNLANIEAGRQGLPLDTLAAIAAPLGATVSDLLGESPAPTVPLALLTKVAGTQRTITKLLAEAAALLDALAGEAGRMERLLADRQPDTECLDKENTE